MTRSGTEQSDKTDDACVTGRVTGQSDDGEDAYVTEVLRGGVFRTRMRT